MNDFQSEIDLVAILMTSLYNYFIAGIFLMENKRVKKLGMS